MCGAKSNKHGEGHFAAHLHVGGAHVGGEITSDPHKHIR